MLADANVECCSSGSEELEVQTLVFIDLETTGLIESQLSCDPMNQRWVPGRPAGRNPHNYLTYYLQNDRRACIPKIVEFSLLAVDRVLYEKAMRIHREESALFNEQKGSHSRDMAHQLKKKSTPCAIKLYTTQLNPQLSEKEWATYEKNFPQRERLGRRHLEKQGAFSDEWPVIQGILKNLIKPACLVAHNGIRFDFRIMLHEIVRSQQHHTFPIPNGIYMLDTYPAFLDLEKDYHGHLAHFVDNVDWPNVTRLVTQIHPQKAEATYPINSAEVEEGPLSSQEAILRKATHTEQVTPEKSNIQMAHEPPRKRRPDTSKDACSVEEVGAGLLEHIGPPVKIPAGRVDNPPEQQACRAKRQLEFSLADTNPLVLMNKCGWSWAKHRRLMDSRNQLLTCTREGHWRINHVGSNNYFYEKGRFSLPNIHEQIYCGLSYNAHRAQDDAKALMMTCLAYGQEFLSYMDNHCVEFSQNLVKEKRPL